MASDELALREGSRRRSEDSPALAVIELCKVDFSDSTYRITTWTDIGRLIKSIDRIGVLVPPLVKPAGDQIEDHQWFSAIGCLPAIGD